LIRDGVLDISAEFNHLLKLVQTENRLDERPAPEKETQ
jgi:hypothetical protein